MLVHYHVNESIWRFDMTIYLSKYVVIENYISLNVVIENLHVLYIDGKKLDNKEHFQYDYHPSF